MHSRNTVRYYLILAGLMLFLFFSNDFGLIDIQKTAIVMAVGVDREESTFIVTAQLAIPQASTQGGETQAVQLESRGETVADALNQINVKTGWYPKLVFCNLIVLGEETVKHNVFDALDYFLRDEYMSDSCLVAACEGTAKELLNTTTPVDPISSLAAQKVLTERAQKVGTVASSSLREFAIGYFSDSRSGHLPVLKQEKQQESSGENSGENGGGEDQSAEKGGEAQGTFGNAFSDDPSPAPAVPAAGDAKSTGNGGGQGGTADQVFSASETALFYDGVMVEKLTPEETFAFCIVKNNLRLAAYSLESDGGSYTLNIKKNKASLKLSVDGNSMAKLSVKVKAIAGIEDVSFSQRIVEIANTVKVSEKIFEDAKEKLEKEIAAVFDKSRKSRCDVFEVLSRLEKFENNYYPAFREDILDRLILDVSVKFEGQR